MVNPGLETGQLVYVANTGPVRRIVLNAPHNRNALSVELVDQLARHVNQAMTDPSVRVVVLGHDGPTFCSGADLKARSGQSAASRTAHFVDVLELIWSGPKPVVAQVSGDVRAGGLGLMGACDLVVVADHVTFGFTEVRIGVAPALIYGVLGRRCAPARLHRLMLTAESFGVADALALELVDEVVSAAELSAAVVALASDIARGAPGAVAATKLLSRTRGATALRADLDDLRALSANLFASPEAQEGMRAFREKRLPAWLLDTESDHAP